MRDPLRRHSVRAKLVVLFAGLGLLAYGLGGLLVSSWAEKALEESILARLDGQAQAGISALQASLGALVGRATDFASDGLIRDRASLLSAVGADPASATDGRGSLAADLRDGLREHLARNKLPLEPAFLNLAVLGERGELIAEVHADEARSLHEAVPAGTTEAERVEARLREGDDAGIVLDAPLRDVRDGRRVGRLLVLVDARPLVTGALASAAGSDAEMALVVRDRAGRVLRSALTAAAGASDPGGSPGPRVDVGGAEAEVLRARLAGQRGTLELNLPLAAAPGWTASVTLGAGRALAPIAGLRNRLLSVGVLLAALSMLMLYFPLRFVVSPLRRLTAAAERLAEGDLDTRVPVDSDDEIGEVGRAFNEMADSIRERTHALQAVAVELRDRQADLKAGRDRLQAVLAAMQDGLVVLDADDRVVLSNAAARPLIGLVERGVLAQGHNRCRDERAGRGDCFACLFDASTSPRSCLVDAEARTYEVHTATLPAEGPRGSGRVLVARDVSDRIARDEREIHNERLAVLGEIAAVMAHELNNPLASISMFNQMLAAELPDDSPLRENTEVIRRNTETAKRTIRELLDYATGATPEVDGLDLHDTLSDVVRFLRPLAERARVKLEVRAGAARPEVTGDEVQLRQVFVNLALNAIQAVADAPGAREVVLATRDAGDRVEIDVSDTGRGIPPALREEVFRPFFTTKERGQGTGLGLPTSRRIAELHGGSLELVETSASGTVFRVRLRARQQAECAT